MSSLDPLSGRLAEIFVESFDRITGESSDPWLRPCGPQQNFGGTVYSGSNRLVLGLLSSLRGYDLPVWVTFGQAHSKGFHVRKGERSAPVVFYDRWIREKATGRRTDFTEEQWRLLPSAERDLYERACVLKWHSVFNICQTDFAERFPQEHSALVGAVGGGVRSGEAHPLVDSLVDEGRWLCPVEIADGSSPSYDQIADVVRMPPSESYADRVRWYCDLFRGMAGSTGSEERFDREIWSGDLDVVARERLVCELAAATSAVAFGMNSYLSDDSMRYLKSWSLAISSDPKVIYQAVNDAAKASNLIVECSGLVQSKGYDLSSVLSDVESERQRRSVDEGRKRQGRTPGR